MEINNISYVGTVLGITIGCEYLANTILFTNLAFMIDRIEKNEYSAALLVSIMLLLSILVLYKKIKQDLMTYECIKKKFPYILKSRHIKNEEDD